MDNSLDRFAPRRAASTLPVFAGVAVLLFGGLVVSIATAAFAVAGIIAAAIIGFAALTYYAVREHRAALGRNATGWIEWGSELPESQRQNISIGVSAISRALREVAGSLSDLQSAFIVAEDLALRQLQEDEGVPVMRHVTILSMPFDVAFAKGDVLVCGEVSYLVSPELDQERLVAMLKKIAAVKKSLDAMDIGMTVRQMFVIVTQMPDVDVTRLRNSLGTARFSSTPVDVDIRIMDVVELYRKFVGE